MALPRSKCLWMRLVGLRARVSLVTGLLLFAALLPVTRLWAVRQVRTLSAGLAEPGAGGPAHIYVITPTHNTPSRELHLLRVAAQLALVPDLTWFIVEDATDIDHFIAGRLNATLSGIRQRFHRSADGFSWNYTHVDKIVHMPDDACRGLEPRFHAVDLLFADIAAGARPHGTIMFLDDDNVYTPHMLAGLRNVTRVGVWPGGNFDQAVFNFPLVSSARSVVGMFDVFSPRRFPLDMANFAVHTTFALSRLPRKQPSRAWRPQWCKAGFLETRMLERLNLKGWTDFEALSFNATAVGFWHTRTANNPLSASRVSVLASRLQVPALRTRLERLLNDTLLPLNPHQAIQQDIQLIN
eukprot:Gregarina_sp_Pseudo_9__5685@NODE_80_length_4505_cov_41_104344_g74_i0_p2_GENE_NODE_80_length_4505_cov_41_104344_g74_i0NODE_80_length_4505_cov_41_104344_g74_i0_p2_ORF_typecomplete_len354_score81_08Glyco_transf_43/PF03360_16/2_9e26_NODE_80_length_4505_cov_41_104344_g74_i09351996